MVFLVTILLSAYYSIMWNIHVYHQCLL